MDVALFMVLELKFMTRFLISALCLFLLLYSLHAQRSDTAAPSSEDTLRKADMTDSFPRAIPNVLPSELFIPSERLFGFLPWNSAPILRPVVFYIPVTGFTGSIGFGEYSIHHPESFFSTLDGYNMIDIPQMYITRQMLLGNTFRLGKGGYMFSGILYGAQMGVEANNWGMGTREGFIWNPSELVSVAFWSQYFQSVSVYSPVLFPDRDGDGAAIKMPATPEIFSFGVQASFKTRRFIIGIGTSVTPRRMKHHR